MVKQGHATSYRVAAVFQDVILGGIKATIDEADRTKTEDKKFYCCGNCEFVIADEAETPIEAERALIQWLETHE
jgi:hypothetical protein